jgi:3D (Asp-Asp-Asp) domain-containing protein
MLRYRYILFLTFLLAACQSSEPEKKLEVTATAYNSLRRQTSGDPTLAAWGDTLRPEMKCIAVSRDLIDSGFTHGTRVKIEGLPGHYIVRDKMNPRWTKKIDIYMGSIEKDAREWGKRTVTIRWRDREKKGEQEK